MEWKISGEITEFAYYIYKKYWPHCAYALDNALILLLIDAVTASSSMYISTDYGHPMKA